MFEYVIYDEAVRNQARQVMGRIRAAKLRSRVFTQYANNLRRRSVAIRRKAH